MYTDAIKFYFVSDLDECTVDNGGCEGICINSISSYRCRCKKKGYRLSADRRSCTGILIYM